LALAWLPGSLWIFEMKFRHLRSESSTCLEQFRNGWARVNCWIVSCSVWSLSKTADMSNYAWLAALHCLLYTLSLRLCSVEWHPSRLNQSYYCTRSFCRFTSTKVFSWCGPHRSHLK
jgi:hypothetical protein